VDSSINQFAEALIRAGIGGPLCVGLGLVVIEAKGRKTGSPRSVPVLANRVGNRLYVSTVRPNHNGFAMLRLTMHLGSSSTARHGQFE
jgi:hypothetical protein